jgi:hypothetical protein
MTEQVPKYTPPAKPGEPWDRRYPRFWWDVRRHEVSKAALARAFAILERGPKPPATESK